MPLGAHIPGIALHGVDKTVFHFLHDTDVISQAVALPIEKIMSPGLGS